LSSSDVVVHRGIRVTALALTVIEAAVKERAGVKLMDSALQRRLGLRELWRAHLRNKGRYGSPRARRLLQAASDGARSEAERLLVKLLREAGIAGSRTNYPIGPYKVDVAFPGLQIVIEVDGWAFHSDQEVFQSDRKRQNYIALMGWQVLRFTWLDLVEYPQRVIAIIRSAISARLRTVTGR
jgi:very-short-patch-repair endonuclease